MAEKKKRANSKPLTYTNWIPNGDGTYTDFKELPPERQKEVSDKITTTLMAALGYRKVASNEPRAM